MPTSAADQPVVSPVEQPADEPSADTGNIEEVCQWLIECIAGHLRLNAGDISTDAPLTDHGLDSLYALTVASEIEDHFGISLDPTVMWNHPTVLELAAVITKGVG